MYSEQFLTANEAFSHLYRMLNAQDESTYGVKRIHNVSIVLHHPWINEITLQFRGWNVGYAHRLWNWYLAKTPSIVQFLGKTEAWDNKHDENFLVNSNYGQLWNEKNQLKKCIEQIRLDPFTTEAWLTLYDGKRREKYQFDTPSAMCIGFTVEQGLLCMSVLVREQELWTEFCNDQYCFSQLQKLVAGELRLDTGWCHYHISNLYLKAKNFTDIQ